MIIVPATGELSANCAFRTPSLYQPGKSAACFRISLTKLVSFSSTAMACEYKWGYQAGGAGSPWPGHAAPTPMRTVCSAWPAWTTNETQAGSDTVYPPAYTNQGSCSWIGLMVPVGRQLGTRRWCVASPGKPQLMVSRSRQLLGTMRSKDAPRRT